MTKRTAYAFAVWGTFLGSLLGPLAYANHWAGIPTYLMAQVASFPAALLVNRRMPRLDRSTLLASLCVTLVSITFYLALDLGAVGTGTLLGGTSIIWSELFLAASGKTRITRWFIVSVVLSLAGATCILNDRLSNAQFIGALTALASGVFYGLWSYFRKTAVDSSPDQTAHEQVLSRVPALPAAAFYFSSDSGRPLLADTTSLVEALAVGATAAVNFICLSRAYGGIAPSSVLMINTLRLPLSATWAFIFLNERPSALAYLGGALVLGGIVIAIREESRRT